jgi:hypothetical protein
MALTLGIGLFLQMLNEQMRAKRTLWLTVKIIALFGILILTGFILYFGVLGASAWVRHMASALH